eukprot:CAMPEP_0204576866 /NCGR_PEP_ID=MMETSP0661-20131031/42023_1 /ASSEMBLY_ACC=CAM_ASM_000606 /TAXON_ID=109239 /ORGANISM="Alexandrium margalefi, Strain AMGDE01CS-322" /LENGTH=38 /DNA_ID= /DNA_START= /DNA_END= /DNA_ORIENTATION=
MADLPLHACTSQQHSKHGVEMGTPRTHASKQASSSPMG